MEIKQTTQTFILQIRVPDLSGTVSVLLLIDISLDEQFVHLLMTDISLDATIRKYGHE